METLKDRKWKVLKSEYIARKPWFTVRKEAVELPNGSVIPEYYTFEYPDWVNVVAVTRDGKFVFVDQYRHGLGLTSYELCAGVCEKADASPLESAKRELLEETGFGGGTWSKLMEICANPTSHTNMAHCFLATDVEQLTSQHLEPTEDLGLHLLTAEEVRQLLYADQIKQSLMAAPLWKLVAMGKI